MADVEFSHDMGGYGSDFEGSTPEARPANSLTTMTNAAGALVSLALIAGVGVWGYKLMVRDVSGIPVVRAATSDMRVRPEEPGGVLARHQGLAVNEIAARGQASGPVDQVRLAPPAVALAAEDQPIVQVSAAPVVQPEPLAPAATALDAPDDARAASDASGPSQQGTIDDVVAELVAGTKPMTSLSGPKVVQVPPAADTTAAVEPDVLVDTADVAIDAPGVQQSARPRLRPSNVAGLVRPVSFTPPAETREVDAAAIPSGTRLAQLGAFDSPDVARAEWARMQERFGEILSGKSRVVQEARSGGRTLYRLRAMGFVDLGDARRFCSAVKAEGVDCIPVQVK